MQDGGGEVRSQVVAAGCSAGEGRIAELGKEQVFPNPLPHGVEPCSQPRGKTGRFCNLSCDQGLKFFSAVFI